MTGPDPFHLWSSWFERLVRRFPRWTPSGLPSGPANLAIPALQGDKVTSPDIPDLLDLACDADPSVSNRSIESLINIMKGLSPTDLPALDVRLRSSTHRAQRWNELDVRSSRAAKYIPITAYFTMHSSGYVRQSAVEHLHRDPGIARALPYFLIRMNDWVAAIRELATQAVRDLLATGDASPWIPVLGLIGLLQSRRRADHAWLTGAVEQLLLRPEAAKALEQAVASPDRRIARFTFAILLGPGRNPNPSIVRAALNQLDVVTRLRAAKAARALPSSPERDALLADMRGDSFMPIRREALYAALELPQDNRLESLRASLMDRHASMRHAARFYLKSQLDDSGEPFDARAHYLNALRERPIRRAAIAGLGETGRADDASAVAPLVASERPGIAAAAVAAVGTLDRRGQLAWLLDRLDDPRPGVSREAARALTPERSGLDAERLREIARRSNYHHARNHALRLLLLRHPYESIIDAIEAVRSAHPRGQQLGRDYVRRFQPPGRYALTPSQARAIHLAIDAAPPELAETLKRRIRSYLDYPPV